MAPKLSGNDSMWDMINKNQQQFSRNQLRRPYRSRKNDKVSGTRFNFNGSSYWLINIVPGQKKVLNFKKHPWSSTLEVSHFFLQPLDTGGCRWRFGCPVVYHCHLQRSRGVSTRDRQWHARRARSFFERTNMLGLWFQTIMLTHFILKIYRLVFWHCYNHHF